MNERDRRTWPPFVSDVTTPRVTSQVFDPGALFPASDPRRVHQVHFLLASQALAALVRLLPLLPEEPSMKETESYLCVWIIAAANEAAIAFENADRADAFREIDQAEPRWKEEKRRLLALRTSTRRGGSIRKLLADCRNKVGFHWDRGYTRSSLSALAGSLIPAVLYPEGGAISAADVAFPIVGELIGKAVERVVGMGVDPNASLEVVADFQVHCQIVAQGLFSLVIEAGGLKLESG